MIVLRQFMLQNTEGHAARIMHVALRFFKRSREKMDSNNQLEKGSNVWPVVKIFLVFILPVEIVTGSLLGWLNNLIVNDFRLEGGLGFPVIAAAMIMGVGVVAFFRRNGHRLARYIQIRGWGRLAVPLVAGWVGFSCSFWAAYSPTISISSAS